MAPPWGERYEWKEISEPAEVHPPQYCYGGRVGSYIIWWRSGGKLEWGGTCQMRQLRRLENSMRDPEDDLFIQRFIQHQSRLYRFIASLAPNRTDAEELFQEACLAAWKTRDRFEPEREMFPWLCGIARNLLRAHFRKQGRQANALDPAVLEQLSERLVEEGAALEYRLEALSNCLKKLPPRQRDFVESYYHECQTVKDFAASMNLNVEAAYKMLQRIRSALRNCIERRVSPSSPS